MNALPPADLREVVAFAAADLERLRGARLLVTGGTGFVGGWITGALTLADDDLRLGLELLLLTRRPEALSPRISGHRSVRVIRADVRELAPMGAVDLVIHAAAPSSAAPGSADAQAATLTSIIVDGTNAVVGASAGARVLFLSSGAVYGPHPGAVDENAEFATSSSAYALAKRLAEQQLLDGSAGVTIARLFSFVGPGLPLERHFAVGNFIADALAGRPLVIRGDGSAVRSYMYPADLVVWLFALLVRGGGGRAYNVGSPEPVTIRELAELVARPAGLPVQVLGGPPVGDGGDFYLPKVDRAVNELGLTLQTPLPAALARTLDWHRGQAT